MTSDPKPMPIPTYAATIDAGGNISPLREWEGGDWCRAADVRGLVERMEKAEAQRDRLAEVLRTAVELSRGYDSDNEACWDMVWASAEDALAAIDKESNA